MKWLVFCLWVCLCQDHAQGKESLWNFILMLNYKQSSLSLKICFKIETSLSSFFWWTKSKLLNPRIQFLLWPVELWSLMETNNTSSTRTSCWLLSLLLTAPCGRLQVIVSVSKIGLVVKGGKSPLSFGPLVPAKKSMWVHLFHCGSTRN